MNLAENLVVLVIVVAFWTALAAALRNWVGLGWLTTILCTAFYGLGLWILVWYGVRALFAQERPYIPAPRQQRLARESAVASDAASAEPAKVLVGAAVAAPAGSFVPTAEVASGAVASATENHVVEGDTIGARSNASDALARDTMNDPSAEPLHEPTSVAAAVHYRTNWTAVALIGVLGLAIGGGAGALARPVTKTNTVTVQRVPASCREVLAADKRGITDALASFLAYDRERTAFRGAITTFLSEQSDSALDAVYLAEQREKDAKNALGLSMFTAAARGSSPDRHPQPLAACNAAP
jgi:hypothetical protein